MRGSERSVVTKTGLIWTFEYAEGEKTSLTADERNVESKGLSANESKTRNVKEIEHGHVDHPDAYRQLAVHLGTSHVHLSDPKIKENIGRAPPQPRKAQHPMLRSSSAHRLKKQCIRRIEKLVWMEITKLAQRTRRCEGVLELYGEIHGQVSPDVLISISTALTDIRVCRVAMPRVRGRPSANGRCRRPMGESCSAPEQIG
jgi:hypothetical protein